MGIRCNQNGQHQWGDHMKQVSSLRRVAGNARAFIQFVITKPCFFGMGFYYAWLYLSFYSTSLFPNSDQTFSLVDSTWAFGAWGFATFLVLYLACLRKILRDHPQRTLTFMAFAITSIGTAVATLPSLTATPSAVFSPTIENSFSEWQKILAAVGMLASGVSSAGIVILWGDSYKNLDTREILGVTSGSMVIGALIFIAAASLPNPLVSTLSILFPLASGACFLRCNAYRQSTGVRLQTDQTKRREDGTRSGSFSPRLLIPLFALFAFSLGGEVLRNLCSALNESAGLSGDLHAEYIASQGVGGGLWLLLSFAIGNSLDLETAALKLARPAFVAMAAAFAALCFAPLSPSTSYGIFGLGFQYVRVFAFAIAVDTAKRCEFSPATAVAFVHLPAALAPCTSPALSPIANLLAAGSALDWNIVFMAFTCAMFITALFVLNEKDFLTVWGMAKVNHSEAIPNNTINGESKTDLSDGERFRQFAATWHLTKRETEVAFLLAKGRNLPYVEEKLVISHGTAQTHQRHIYEKTGVHSRREFLDLIECSMTQKIQKEEIED